MYPRGFFQSKEPTPYNQMGPTILDNLIFHLMIFKIFNLVPQYRKNFDVTISTHPLPPPRNSFVHVHAEILCITKLLEGPETLGFFKMLLTNGNQ